MYLTVEMKEKFSRDIIIILRNSLYKYLIIIGYHICPGLQFDCFFQLIRIQEKILTFILHSCNFFLKSAVRFSSMGLTVVVFESLLSSFRKQVARC